MNLGKSISVEEQKKIALDVLLDVAEFCDEHGLRYFLAYGTLIGAIRHNGYIPWDDDIDVHMPREDYNKLISIYNEQRKTDRYELIDPRSKKARHSFVKVVDTRTAKIEPGIDYQRGYLGVDIDIFPLDGVPSDEGEHREWFMSLKKIYSKYFFCTMDTKKNIKHRIGVPLIKLCTGGTRRIVKRASKAHAKFPYNECEYVGMMENYYDIINDRYKKEWFAESVLWNFEGYKIKIPVGYHEILTQLYGDYMQLPPEEERVTHHRNVAYWLE